MNHRSDSASGSGDGAFGQLLSQSTILNRGTDDELECVGYCDNSSKKVIFYLLTILTFGLFLLFLYWKPELECYWKKSICALYKADTVLLKDSYGHKYVSYVKTINAEKEMPQLSETDAYNRDNLSVNHVEADDTVRLSVNQDSMVHYFDHQHIRYVWNNFKNNFHRLEDLSTNIKCVSLHENYHGLSAVEQSQRRVLHGENSIDVEVKSYWRLFIEEVLNPFYIFQICSVIIWNFDSYYYYAGCILIISCISIGVSLYETRKQMITLHDMVKTTATAVTVARSEGCYEDIPLEHLVPGDVIAIPTHSSIMNCDAVLISGTCIVNESMLTGESVPVTKTPLSHQEDEEIYSPNYHKRHTLFAGTHVVQTRYNGNAKVLAVVARTGFNTAKGELVRAILFPKPLGFKFYQDAMKFVLFLACVAVLGVIYSVVTYIRLKAEVAHIVIRVLDIITIIVPPALPAAMTVGTVYAQSRLKKNGIFCISPPRINFCGRLNIFCFDKTGTLTEDGLDMWGILPVSDKIFTGVLHDPSELHRCPFLIGMVTCHSLTIIDGEVTGDPLDLIMFNSTKWTLDEPGGDTSRFETIMPVVVRPSSKEKFLPFEHDLGMPQFEVGIVRQFTFSSALQRMSVITRTLGEDSMEVYCKGAPEKIVSLCDPNTVPRDFNDVLHKYTIQGFRVIALGYDTLDSKINWHQAQKISRDKVECNLKFLGLIVMQNKLKEQTTPVIKTLRQANIRTVMITGDMIKTAISVARNCRMVQPRDQVIIVNAHNPDKDGPARIEWEPAEMPVEENGEYAEPDQESSGSIEIECAQPRIHLAVSGKSYSLINTHFPHLMQKICVQGTIFARMSPDQKCSLVEKLQELGYSVGMCGDGANDCEALKAAHAGISLSEAEASVAAPFTSHMNNIECVVAVMREGRAALVTSFGCFKYMALYSFIQFSSVLILYTFGVDLADMQFLYIDLVITTTVAILMGYTKSYHKLVAQRPEGSLVKLSNLLSILIQVVLAVVILVAALLYLRSQAWYKQVPLSKSLDIRVCWETTVIFAVSSFQYMTVAFVFSKGPPFRKPIYSNIPFLASLIVLVAFSTFLVLIPLDPFVKFFGMVPLQEKSLQFRGLILTFAGVHLIASIIFEYLVTSSSASRMLYKWLRRNRPSKSIYKRVQKEIENSDWPPVGQVTYETKNHRRRVSESHIIVDTLQSDSN
ncbi:hypothetical protein ACJMK2_008316 [Sinanodonta woodiana]|uniref:Cation-transporting ATPase n=1 Tax=Sinanodonta woodiana TaxID=1069815 RepID=A0ABD3VL76_SINWO